MLEKKSFATSYVSPPALLHAIITLVHNAAMSSYSNSRPRTLALHLVIIAALLASSCRKVDAPADADAGADVDVPALVPAGFVSLELKNEPVDDVLQKLAAAAGKPFVIDPDAQAVAHCARITLLTGGNMPAGKALDLVREALDASGLTLVESSTGGIIVRRNPDKPLPAACENVASLASPPNEPGAVTEAADKFAEGVRRISDTEYELSRASIDLLLNHPATISRSARIVPQMQEGKTVGLRLFGVRAKSPFSVLGFKNGDTVTHVGDRPITTPDEALQIYSSLKTATTFEVTIERRKQTMKMVYRLTEKKAPFLPR